jgi:uncharacterized protein YutE (UPF0331/DUF86 family)
LIRTHKMGNRSAVPTVCTTRHETRDSHQFVNKMRGMVGFCNIAVRKLNVDIVEAVSRTGFDGLWAFTNYVVKYLKSAPAS